jgi:multidrug efflux system membrane fusion protein
MKVYFHEGELVREGALLAEIDPRPGQVSFTQAHGQLIRDQASLAQAEMDLHRYEPLAQHQAIPQQQKDQQVSLVQQYRGAVEADQGQIDNANLTLIYSRITAPLSGRIGLRLVDPGNIVHASDTGGILTITQVAPITVVFNLAEDDLPKLQRALQANPHISVEAWDRANQIRIASGRILSLDNSIDPTSGTLKIKAVFDNKVATLFPNEFVNIRVETDVRQDALLVPDTAVQRNGDTAYVYVLSNDQTVHVRPVQVGLSNEGRAEILSGLQNGDVVVVKGFDKLQDAIRVSTIGNENARQSGNVQ